jgi:hypothetical protein
MIALILTVRREIGEESPDSTGRDVPEDGGGLSVIEGDGKCRRKQTATGHGRRKRAGSRGKGEKVV